VFHIQSRDAATPHKLIPPATIRDGQLSYGAEQTDLL
jgi:hypothetical protein